MVARCTRRKETTGISSRAYGSTALCQCLTLHVASRTNDIDLLCKMR